MVRASWEHRREGRGLVTDAAEPERGSVTQMANCSHCEGMIGRCARTEPWRHVLTGLVPCGIKWAVCSTCWEIIVKMTVWRHRFTGEIRCGK